MGHFLSGAVGQFSSGENKHKPAPLGDIGSTTTLEILPLVDWHASRGDLATDVGVSYLVKTDDLTILFDTGNNTGGASPSPLERNMAALGVRLEDVDAVVISHAHFDHIGGRTWSGREGIRGDAASLRP